MRRSTNGVALVMACVLVVMGSACRYSDQPEPSSIEDHVDVDRHVDVDPAPPNLPYLPDYAVETCGWAGAEPSVTCFQEALNAGRGAEIYFQYGTIEGDTVYAIARLSPDGEIVLFTDHSDDDYAGLNLFRSRTCIAAGFTVNDGDIPWESCGDETPGW